MITNNGFELDSQLASDTWFITDLTLSTVLLMNDSQFPWCILVPRVDNIVEITQLSQFQRRRLWDESDLISRAMQSVFNPDKLNIGAIGNVVSQLHVHHVARYCSDVLWPKPVWGQLPTKPYTENSAELVIDKLKQQLEV